MLMFSLAMFMIMLMLLLLSYYAHENSEDARSGYFVILASGAGVLSVVAFIWAAVQSIAHFFS